MANYPETGKENWKIEMEFLVFGNNAYSKNILYIGTTNGKLHAISRSSGKKIWSFETESYHCGLSLDVTFRGKFNCCLFGRAAAALGF